MAERLERKARGEEETSYVDAPLEPQLSLYDFFKQAWHVVEPATPFIPNWHLEAIAEHLEAVTRGEIRNLVINMPPRCAKSLAVSVFWPTWVWTFKPHTRWLYSSYALSLSIRDSLKCRRLIESPWYQQRWSNMFCLAGDQNVKSRFENTKTGYRLATSVGGAVTGEGGDVIVCDDPHNVKDAPSEAMREAAVVWWDESMSTRGNNPKTVAKVIVQQRVHEDDLTGHVLKQGGYELLCLPMEYEPTERATSIGWIDPRMTEGELLWGERFGQKEVDDLKLRLGSYGVAGQLQQRPAPLGGGMVKLSWFHRYRTAPHADHIETILQSWDTANKAKELNDPWVCTTWAATDSGYYLLDVLRERMDYPTGKRTVRSLAEKWKPHVILVEDKSSGQSLIQELQLDSRLPILAVEPEADKVTRMSTESPIIEAGRCWLPESAPWLVDYERELSTFPNSQHDDQVDSTSQALKYFREHTFEPRVRRL